MRIHLDLGRARWRIWSAAGACALAIAAAACGHVQPHLVLPSLTVGDRAFADTVTGYTEAPIVGGNRITVLLNGDEIFPAKLAIIRAATKTINYAQYVFEEGQPADDVARALAERCRAGVAVNVLVDAVGAMAMPAEQREIMMEAGCRVETFRPIRPFTLDRVNYRNHRRILVADGRVGITGGSGTSGKWSGNGRTDGHWRDTDVRVEGPVVAQLQGAFVENWLEATGIALGGDDYFPRLPAAPGGVGAQAVRSSPAGGSVAMYTMFLLGVASARRSIHITNPYFVPDEKMVETLVQTARRGVRVVLHPARRHRPQHRPPGEPRRARPPPRGRGRGVRVPRRAPPRQDHGDRRRLVHGRQHQPRPPVLRPQRRAEPGRLRSGGGAAASTRSSPRTSRCPAA